MNWTSLKTYVASQITWLAGSRKAKVAIAAIIAAVVARLGFAGESANAMTAAITALGSVWIAGIAHEDAAAKSAPTVQTNVDSNVSNAPVTPPTPTPEAITKAIQGNPL